MQFVIPGLTKPAPYLIRGNPVFFWIPAGVYPVPRYGAGMTPFAAINVAVYNTSNLRIFFLHLVDKFLKGQKHVMLSFVVTKGLYSASTLFVRS